MSDGITVACKVESYRRDSSSVIYAHKYGTYRLTGHVASGTCNTGYGDRDISRKDFSSTGCHLFGTFVRNFSMLSDDLRTYAENTGLYFIHI